MTPARWLALSLRWFRFLARFYPPDFRDEMGDALVDTYVARARDTIATKGAPHLLALWFRASLDSLRNGLAETISPAAAWRRSGAWGRDLELVTRRLGRAPVFTASALATLTIGLGMFAVVYTAVQRVLLDPMPFKEPGDLYYVWRDYGSLNDIRRGALAGPDIAELQKGDVVVESVAGLRPMLGGIFARRPGADSMEIAVAHASPNLFQLLGVELALGRSFVAEEEGLGPGREQAIVLTHHLWNRLGADPAIVGAEVWLQGRAHTVVGVLPRSFAFTRNDAAAAPQPVDAYIPFEEKLVAMNPRNPAYSAVLRARRGTDRARVAAAVDAVGRRIDQRDFAGRGVRLFPVPMKDDVVSRIRPALVTIAAAGAVLLFMLAVNLSSVLLARAAQRDRELAVSRALGANTAAIVRSTLFEGALLGGVGGALGSLVASWGCRALVAFAPADLPRREAIALDAPLALVVILVGTLLGVLAALAPAFWAARASVSALLASAAVRGGGGQGRWRRSLIVVQVALSLVLLSSGALVLRTLERLWRADAGFDPHGVFTVKVRTPPEFFPKPADTVAFQDRVLQSLAAIPGVTAVGASSALPLMANAGQLAITAPGAPGNTGDAERDILLADLIGVRGNFFAALNVRLVEGRRFEPVRENGVAEIMLDASAARRFYPRGGALGNVIQLGKRAFTIVGVFQQPRLYSLHADGRPQVLIRAEDFGIRPLFYLMRTTRDAASLLPDATLAVRRVDSRVPVGEPRTLASIVSASRSPQTMGASLVGAFGLGALLLTAMGLFGVVAGSVSRRRQELAIRLAIGADHRRVLRLVLREGALLVGLGLALGAPGIYVGYRVVESLLVGSAPLDFLALAAAALGLFGIGLAACYIPARRVLQLDPSRILQG